MKDVLGSREKFNLTARRRAGGKDSISSINQDVVACTKCPRLRRYCEAVSRERKKAYRNQNYWSKPLPGFGDVNASIVIIGLAPSAHGGNRTGRIFTGDRSGDWLFRAIFEAGLSNQPSSQARDDGLTLRHIYINAIVRCAPPKNRPLPIEVKNCSEYLKRDFSVLKKAKVYVALGRTVFETVWPLLNQAKSRPPFTHGKVIELPDQRHLVLSYHPSPQNTSTKRLTAKMLLRVLKKAEKLAR